MQCHAQAATIVVAMQKQVTSCIQLYISSGQFTLHVPCDLNTTLATHSKFAQDNQGYYVQDLISDNYFDDEETDTAFCERYMSYHFVTVKMTTGAITVFN